MTSARYTNTSEKLFNIYACLYNNFGLMLEEVAEQVGLDVKQTKYLLNLLERYDLTSHVVVNEENTVYQCNDTYDTVGAKQAHDIFLACVNVTGEEKTPKFVNPYSKEVYPPEPVQYETPSDQELFLIRLGCM